MNLRSYLPSTQFTVIVASLAVSGGLVSGAYYLTKRPPAALHTASPAPQNPEWLSQLSDIQQSSGISLPKTPSKEAVQTLIEGATTGNLTDSVARTLLINLTNAKAQGLGDDAPTQNELVAQALALAGKGPSTIYTASDLTIVSPTETNLHSYGNKVMAAFAAHPEASASAVLQAVGGGVDYRDAEKLEPLTARQSAYTALVHDLGDVPIPQTLSPLHVQLLNDLSSMANATGDMQSILSDPVRGLRGVESFVAKGNEATRVLTTLAGTLSKNGILFSKDEPGSAWAAFLSLSYTQ